MEEDKTQSLRERERENRYVYVASLREILQQFQIGFVIFLYFLLSSNMYNRYRETDRSLVKHIAFVVKLEMSTIAPRIFVLRCGSRVIYVRCYRVAFLKRELLDFNSAYV